MTNISAIITHAPQGGVKYAQIQVKDPQKYEVKLKPVYTGICGTDRGIVAGVLPFTYNPPNSEYLVLGHEALCEVLDIQKNEYGIKKGDYVIPLVRRPGGCVNCAIGRADNCSDGDRVEAGISGYHGFMQDYFYDKIKYLTKLKDPTMTNIAVLAEPLKNVMKAFEVFDTVSKRAVYASRDSTYFKKTTLIIGTGAEALLYSFMSIEYGFNTVLTNRHDIADLKKEILTKIGAEFFDYSKDTNRFLKDGIDLLIDTSGDPGTVLKFLRKLNHNGIAILFGTNGKAPGAMVDGNDINYIVERNISIVGSVDGAKKHYAMALEYLQKWKYVYGTTLDKLITGTYAPDQVEIFRHKPKGEIKSVISWK